MLQSLWRTVWEFLTQLNRISIDPAIMLLGIYSNELKAYAYTKTCIQAFIAVLSIIAKTWKQDVHQQINE